MIARAKPRRRKTHARKNTELFLTMLPLIHEQARHAFRDKTPEHREELIAEVTANCWVAFVRLLDRGLHDVIYATPLAQFAIKQVCDGRKVGTSLNIKDVSSDYAQRRQGFTVESLDRYDQKNAEWREILVEDRHAGPAEVACCRLDFEAWLAELTPRQRKIAKTLATGETTKATAKKHRVTAGRISQTRRELMAAWYEFIGEDQEAMAAATT